MAHDQIDSETWDRLRDIAIDAMERAYAPYSHFHVGAALLASSGEIYPGVNIENATYGATVCAERSAVSAAVTAGDRDFEAICIATPAAETVAPCGICRQVLAEFAEELPVLLVTKAGREEHILLSDLLPHVFRGSDFSSG